jgi:BirA family transcriptional regulator, biotin operon repressor / biotin---[acetyl-CoA-carboxylase] ligase
MTTLERPLPWKAEALRAQLASVLPGLHVEVMEQTASTNSTLLERARGARPPEIGEPAPAQVRRSIESAAFRPLEATSDASQSGTSGLRPCLLVAERQTAGRGRQGRPWHSVPGASLTFSLAVPLQPLDWSGLSLAVGVALADALDPPAQRPARIGLKWPNDLWLMDGAGAGRKLGGILIETLAAGDGRLAVIGIGLNVKPLALNDVSTGVASLQELEPVITAPEVLHRVALPLALVLRQFESTGFAPFAARFSARDLLLGRAVRTTQPDVPEGVAQGVSAAGELLVQTAEDLKAVSSGEVSVRLTPPADRVPVDDHARAMVAPPSC